MHNFQHIHRRRKWHWTAYLCWSAVTHSFT